MKIESKISTLTSLLFGVVFLLYNSVSAATGSSPMATGDLGVIIERNKGSVAIVNTTHHKVINRVTGLGNLSHATIVFSRDTRYFYTFQRDGWVNKVDLLSGKVVAQTNAGKNSIGGAISQDGKTIAVSNYFPGDIRILDSTTLKTLKTIPASYFNGKEGKQRSRTVGVVDAPGNQFFFSLLDTGEIWQVSAKKNHIHVVKKWKNVGQYPYDALLTSNGRYYIVGFLKSNWVVRLDLWNLEKGPQKVTTLDPNLHTPKVPMYKVPHLSGWGIADGKAFLPMISEERLMVYDLRSWSPLGSIQTHGTVVFAVPRPDEREIWLTFAGPKGDTLQIIDVAKNKVVQTEKIGKSVMHLQFTPKGEAVYLSVRGENRVEVRDAYSRKVITSLKVEGPSGIFFTNRAHILGL